MKDDPHSEDSELKRRLWAFLEAAHKEQLVWGQTDCSAWPARWVEEVHGRKMQLPLWESREEALELMRQAGSLEALWTRALGAYGLHERFGDPLAGDVGVIQSNLFGQIGGIFTDFGIFAWRTAPAGCRLIGARPHTWVKVWALDPPGGY